MSVLENRNLKASFSFCRCVVKSIESNNIEDVCSVSAISAFGHFPCLSEFQSFSLSSLPRPGRPYQCFGWFTLNGRLVSERESNLMEETNECVWGNWIARVSELLMQNWQPFLNEGEGQSWGARRWCLKRIQWVSLGESFQRDKGENYFERKRISDKFGTVYLSSFQYDSIAERFFSSSLSLSAFFSAILFDSLLSCAFLSLASQVFASPKVMRTHREAHILSINQFPLFLLFLCPND